VAEQRYRITFHRWPTRDGWSGELTGAITECFYVERKRWCGWARVSPGLASKGDALEFLDAIRTPHETRVVWECDA
jgi:hypothetical protein